MRTLLLAGSTLLALAAATGPVRAAYTVTFTQTGPDVVANGIGRIDLDGVAFLVSGDTSARIIPNIALELTGSSGPADLYTASFTGPGSLGPSGDRTDATAGAGSLVGFDATDGLLVVPKGYVSGALLDDVATYAGQTLATLGLTPGSYVYGISSGEDADTITVSIGFGASSPVPEPASLALFGTGLAGLGLIRRRRRG